jgi:hypothetical protein
VCRFSGQRATVTLHNSEHDDSEHQQRRIRSHHDHLLRRFLHPQLPKIIIARQQEWTSCIVRVFWYADDRVADMAPLNIHDNTSPFCLIGSESGLFPEGSDD